MQDSPPITRELLERVRLEPPAELHTALGQLTADDRPLYYALARHIYEGWGEIVDAGALIGASAKLLAAGVRDNPRITEKAGRIQVYDLFEDAVDGPVATQIGDILRARDGDPAAPRSTNLLTRLLDRAKGKQTFDFQPIFDQEVAELRDYLQVFRGDITSQYPAGDSPVELLSIDVAKSPDLMLAVANNFFPRLVPGKSRIVHQDYIFVFQPWLLIFMELLSDYFEKEFDTYCCSTVFRLTRAIEPEDIRRLVGESGSDYYKLENAGRIHDAIRHCDSRYGKIMLSGALAYFYLVQGHIEAARQIFLLTAREYDISGELVRSSELILLLNQHHLNLEYRGVQP